MRRPMFIFGLARSGTNLLARMLDRHPDVRIALDPLMPVFRSLRNAVIFSSAPESVRRSFDPASPFQDYYFDPDGASILDTLLQGKAGLTLDAAEVARLRNLIHERASLESPTLASDLVSVQGKTYSELLQSALDLIASSKPKAAWVGCKEVWTLDFLPLLARTFPEAKFYVIERDPRAIVASLFALGQRDSSQAAHPPSYMRHWRKGIALARRFAADSLLRSRFRIVPYEQLAVQPEPEARRICSELDIEYNSDMLSLSADGWTGNSSFAEGKDVYGSSIERWRHSLPPPIARTVDFLCGPEMALTSYLPQSNMELTDDIRSYLTRADSEPVSWRSGSGDAASSAQNEVLRHQMLRASDAAPEHVIRQLFLFAETFGAIRRSCKGDFAI